MSLSVKFDDQELGRYLSVLSGFSPFSGVNRESELLDGAESAKGEDFGYTTYKSKTLEMPFEIKGDILASYDAIQKILNVTEPKRLVFGNYPDRYYAVPDGNFDITQVAMFGKGTITWLIPDGVAYSTAEFAFDGVQKRRLPDNHHPKQRNRMGRRGLRDRTSARKRLYRTGKPVWSDPARQARRGGRRELRSI